MRTQIRVRHFNVVAKTNSDYNTLYATVQQVFKLMLVFGESMEQSKWFSIKTENPFALFKAIIASNRVFPLEYLLNRAEIPHRARSDSTAALMQKSRSCLCFFLVSFTEEPEKNKIIFALIL